MKRWLMTGAVTEVTLLICLTAAAPAFAGSALTGGARPTASVGAGGSIRGEGVLQAIPTLFQEVTATFTATPTTGTLGDAIEASRATFSTAEAIEFDAVLFESGLAGTTANLQVFLFDSRGRSIGGFFFVSGVLAPSDQTGFFITLGPGSVPAGQFNWVMLISDAFGNAFVTPFQALIVQ